MSLTHRTADRPLPRPYPDFAARLWSQPWLLLAIMACLFGANGVAARLATHAMPPLCLVFLRWFGVCVALAIMLRREQWRDLRALVRGHWFRLAWMSLFAYSGFNAIFFLAAYTTSAVNLSLLQTAIPPFTLAGALILFGTRVRALQLVGMALTILGVLVVAAHGDLTSLAHLQFGRADACVLAACAFYAAYALGLRSRPQVAPLVFFAGLALAAMVWALPMAAVEIARGDAYRPSLQGWLVTLFVAIGPSFVAQLFFMRAVDLIGPGRAGLATNLVPVFGALCAILVLHEPFMPAHAAALALGLGGIALAEWSVARALRATLVGKHRIIQRAAVFPGRAGGESPESMPTRMPEA